MFDGLILPPRICHTPTFVGLRSYYFLLSIIAGLVRFLSMEMIPEPPSDGSSKVVVPHVASVRLPKENEVGRGGKHIDIPPLHTCNRARSCTPVER